MLNFKENTLIKRLGSLEFKGSFELMGWIGLKEQGSIFFIKKSAKATLLLIQLFS